MPNLIAHVGAQGLLTKAAIPTAAPRWIVLACLLPDVPWIAQRALRLLGPGVDTYELRAYAIVQASLPFCLLLAGAVAMLSRTPRAVFVILALNAPLHLLLDSVETKWANGVHLLAPLSWELWNAGLFWPESLAIALLTLLGLVYAVYAWFREPPKLAERPPAGGDRRTWQIATAGLLAIGWAVLPLPFRGEPLEADNHFMRTLQAEQRAGRYVELDRVSYVEGERGPSVQSLTEEMLLLTEPLLPESSGLVSIRGTFVSDNRLRVSAVHVHPTGVRDGLSYLGLALLAALWLRAWRRGRKSRPAIGSWRR